MTVKATLRARLQGLALMVSALTITPLAAAQVGPHPRAARTPVVARLQLSAPAAPRFSFSLAPQPGSHLGFAGVRVLAVQPSSLRYARNSAAVSLARPTPLTGPQLQADLVNVSDTSGLTQVGLLNVADGGANQAGLINIAPATDAWRFGLVNWFTRGAPEHPIVLRFNF